MNRLVKKTLILAILAVVIPVFTGATYYNGGGDKWQAPPTAKDLANPMAKFKSNAKVLKAGAKLFALQCLTCHGESGKGDGPNAKFLEKRPKDLTDPAVQAQTDGELFWKITNGRAPMPTFDKILNPNQRWMIVNYLRTLK